MLLIEPEAVLETERLCLEPLLRSHAAILFPLLQDERIYRYIPQDPPISVAALEERYHRLENRLSPTGDEAWLNWAVAANGRLAGEKDPRNRAKRRVQRVAVTLRSKRAGNVTIIQISSSTPRTATPTSRKGIRISQTIG